MLQKQTLSDTFSLNLRKFLLGPIFSIAGFLMLLYGNNFIIFLGIFLLLIGVLFMLLRKVEFDHEFIYIGSRKFTFDQLKEISSIDINKRGFPYLVFLDNGRKRRYLTDIGQVGLLRFIIGQIFPSLDPHKKLKQFLELHKKSQISV